MISFRPNGNIEAQPLSGFFFSTKLILSLLIVRHKYDQYTKVIVFSCRIGCGFRTHSHIYKILWKDCVSVIHNWRNSLGSVFFFLFFTFCFIIFYLIRLGILVALPVQVVPSTRDLVMIPTIQVVMLCPMPIAAVPSPNWPNSIYCFA